MTLVIEPGALRERVLQDLAQLVPTSIWSIDKFGHVTVHASLNTPAARLLTDIVLAPGEVRVTGTEAGAIARGAPLREIGGFTMWDPAAQGPSAKVLIYYDTTSNYGLGYWGHGDGGTKVDIPSHIVLAHEFGHARWVLTRQSSGGDGDDPYAIDVENEVRRSQVPPLPSRVGHDGGANEKPKPSSKTPTPPKPSRGCFVATAAYGSRLHPSVCELRKFRDEVLRSSETGSDYFEHFYEIYAKASVPVVQAMADEEVRNVVLTWLVKPIVNYLELFREFPELELDAAGPFAPFLAKVRDGLEDLASAVPLPSKLAARPAHEALRDLLVALRFQLRSAGRREAWLAELRAAGELPLQVRDEEERARLAAVIDLEGRSRAEALLILGPTRAPSSGTAVAFAFGHDKGTLVDARSWRYTVTLRNDPAQQTTYSNLRVYYLAKPGNPDQMGYVTLDTLLPGEIGVFPLCECSRLYSYYLEAKFEDPVGSGTMVWPDQGSMTPARAGDANPCEDSFLI